MIALLYTHLIWTVAIVCGVLIALNAPRLARMRLYLAPPHSTFGRGALTVAMEAFAVGLVVNGLCRLLPTSSVVDILSLIGTLAFIAGFMAILAGALAEITLQKRDGF